MKLTERIFKNDSEELTVCELFFDQNLTKGLYLVGDEAYVKRNVKALNIEYQVPDVKTRMGVKFSKHYEFVVVTIIILDDSLMQHKFQFIVKKDCTISNIFNCRHEILEGMRDILSNAIQILNINTLGDLLDWEKGTDDITTKF